MPKTAKCYLGAYCLITLLTMEVFSLVWLGFRYLSTLAKFRLKGLIAVLLFPLDPIKNDSSHVTGKGFQPIRFDITQKEYSFK